LPDRSVDKVWHVYIVKCADRSLYTGVAKDVGARIEQHNSGRGAKYTRTRRPVELVYLEPAGDRSAALRREIAIKRMRSTEKVELIIETEHKLSEEK
jgi:predicted GIY-YIG superfamily endonuclease